MRKMTKLMAAALGLGLTVCSLTAMTAMAEEEVKIACIPASIAGNDFWASLIPSMAEYAEEQGYYFYSEECNNDAAKQFTAIENAVNKGCKAIFVNPVDFEGIDSYLVDLMDQGVYIMGNTTLLHASAIITVDQYNAGEVAAQQAIDYIKEHFDGKAEIGIIQNTQEGAAIIERVDGIKDTLQKAIDEGELPGSEVVAAVDAVTIEETMTVTENMMTAHPDMKVIILYGDALASGAYEAIKGNQDVDPDFALFTAGDGTNAALALVAEDSFYKSTIVFDMNIQKEILVDVPAAMAKGEEFEYTNFVDATVATPDTALQYVLE